jgi:hypothetical protein
MVGFGSQQILKGQKQDNTGFQKSEMTQKAFLSTFSI